MERSYADLSVVLFRLQLFGLVRGSGVRRPAGAPVCEPGLPERAFLPDLRLRRGADGLPPAALWGKPGRAAGGQYAGGVCPGVAGGLFAGEGLSSEVVGLLRPAPQPKRLCVFEVFPGVGRGRCGDRPVRHALFPPAGRPHPPHGERGGPGGAGGLAAGGLRGDGGGHRGPEPEAEEPGVRHRQAAGRVRPAGQRPGRRGHGPPRQAGGRGEGLAAGGCPAEGEVREEPGGQPLPPAAAESLPGPDLLEAQRAAGGAAAAFEPAAAQVLPGHAQAQRGRHRRLRVQAARGGAAPLRLWAVLQQAVLDLHDRQRGGLPAGDRLRPGRAAPQI